MTRFLDTNVIIRYLTGDDPTRMRASHALLQRLGRREEEAAILQAHVAEAAYALSSRRNYGLSNLEVAGRLSPVIRLPGLRLNNKKLILAALDVYAEYPFLDFEDALAVAFMEEEGSTEIYSYDTDFDRLAGVVRLEPPSL